METDSLAQIPVADGSTLPAYVAEPPQPGRTAVVVVHELFGVNPGIRQVADDFAAAGHLSIAPEFYHRDVAPGTWLQRDDAGRAEGFALLNKLERDRAVADVAGAMRWLRGRPGVERVAVVGFSLGGHLAYLAATRLPVDLTVAAYPGWLPTTDIPLSRPRPTLELTGGITGRVLFLVGEDDKLVGALDRDRIRDALTRSGVWHEFVTYPGVGHAYFWPETDAYDAEARDDTWRILAFVDG